MNNDELIRLARVRMEEAYDADRENREEALDDLDNIVGDQWPDHVRTEREADGRPCLTINRLPQFLRQVTGDLRKMNPAINVIAADSAASPEIAEIYEGIVRHIQHASDASSVYEHAAENAAASGLGVFRVITDWVDDQSFEQEIQIKRIRNPLSVYFDPTAEQPTREDAEYAFITDKMRTEEFEKQHPGKQLVDVNNDADTDGLEYWRDGDNVIVAEYYWKEPIVKKIGMLKDGTIVENPKPPMNFVRERKVNSYKVMWAKISGKEVLQGPLEQPTKYIPVIAVPGEEWHVGDRVHRSSVIRYAKDPQRLYNYWRSAQTELIALQPKAPYILTAKQVAGFEDFWNDANTQNRAYLPYNPDEKAPGAPKREAPPVASQGMMAEVAASAEDMHATTGIYPASLGERSNETSGIAIRQRQAESDVSTSIYSDNMAKAIEYCGRIIVDMIPIVYDTQRVVRTLGKDDTEDMVMINQLFQTQLGPEIGNNVTVGKYDVKVSVGPNYSTKRQEAAESMLEFIRVYPQAAGVVGDLIAENMDWPGADQFAERLKKMLPPGFVDPEDMSDEERQAYEANAQQAAQQNQMVQAGQEAEIRKTIAQSDEAEADARKKHAEALSTQLEVMAQTGQLDAAISMLVQQEVARALQGAMVPQGMA